MNALTISLKQKLTLILLSMVIVWLNQASANSDKTAMDEVQRAREMARHQGNHVKEFKPIEESQKFRGVYYGYLPCKHCAGIKMTLSLKNRKNYLLVTQYAQASTKEFYEKGKYDWDEKAGRLTLVSRKDSSERKFQIKDAGTIIQLTDEGTPMKGNQDEYTLLRSDKNKSREVHIH